MPTSAYYKFQDYVEQLNKAKHDWSTHDFRAVLCLTAPTAANAVLGDLTQIASGGGYTQLSAGTGGIVLDSETLSESSGTAKVTIADEVLTATAGGVASFRYVAIVNNSTTSPSYPLVCYLDYGSSVTLAEGETLTIDFDDTNGLWQMT